MLLLLQRYRTTGKEVKTGTVTDMGKEYFLMRQRVNAFCDGLAFCFRQIRRALGHNNHMGPFSGSAPLSQVTEGQYIIGIEWTGIICDQDIKACLYGAVLVSIIQ
ncbi:hypothetical protein D3C87_1346370 [compost metagenome]